MAGSRMQKTREAQKLFILSLPQDSYFKVISIGSTQLRMFPESRRYRWEAIDQAVD